MSKFSDKAIQNLNAFLSYFDMYLSKCTRSVKLFHLSLLQIVLFGLRNKLIFYIYHYHTPSSKTLAYLFKESCSAKWLHNGDWKKNLFESDINPLFLTFSKITPFHCPEFSNIYGIFILIYVCFCIHIFNVRLVQSNSIPNYS